MKLIEGIMQFSWNVFKSCGDYQLKGSVQVLVQSNQLGFTTTLKPSYYPENQLPFPTPPGSNGHRNHFLLNVL